MSVRGMSVPQVIWRMRMGAHDRQTRSCAGRAGRSRCGEHRHRRGRGAPCLFTDGCRSAGAITRADQAKDTFQEVDQVALFAPICQEIAFGDGHRCVAPRPDDLKMPSVWPTPVGAWPRCACTSRATSDASTEIPAIDPKPACALLKIRALPEH